MPDNREANKSVARRLADEVFGQGDPNAFDEIIFKDYVHHNIPVPGIPGTKAGFRHGGRPGRLGRPGPRDDAVNCDRPLRAPPDDAEAVTTRPGRRRTGG